MDIDNHRQKSPVCMSTWRAQRVNARETLSFILIIFMFNANNIRVSWPRHSNPRHQIVRSNEIWSHVWFSFYRCTSLIMTWSNDLIHLLTICCRKSYLGATSPLQYFCSIAIISLRCRKLTRVLMIDVNPSFDPSFPANWLKSIFF